MAGRKRNEARILGIILIALGVVVLLTSGKANKLFHDNGVYKGGAEQFITLSDAHGNSVVASLGTGEMANHNAAEDSAFNGTADAPEEESLADFLGLYDADLATALEILLFAGGGLLILASFAKPRF